VRTVHSSPQALWVSGQIQSPTGISVSDLGNYGTEGILDDEDDENEGRPLMFPFSFDISEKCRKKSERFSFCVVPKPLSIY
jgi:hypothetical protein